MTQTPESHAPAHELVVVIVDNEPHKIAEGAYSVADFKAQVGVDASKDLDEIVHGQLDPLGDDTILNLDKSGRRFVSHVRRGGSS